MPLIRSIATPTKDNANPGQVHCVLAAQYRPAKAVDNTYHGIERVEQPVSLGHHATLKADGRKI